MTLCFILFRCFYIIIILFGVGYFAVSPCIYPFEIHISYVFTLDFILLVYITPT